MCILTDGRHQKTRHLIRRALLALNRGDLPSEGLLHDFERWIKDSEARLPPDLAEGARRTAEGISLDIPSRAQPARSWSRSGDRSGRPILDLLDELEARLRGHGQSIDQLNRKVRRQSAEIAGTDLRLCKLEYSHKEMPAQDSSIPHQIDELRRRVQFVESSIASTQDSSISDTPDKTPREVLLSDPVCRYLIEQLEGLGRRIDRLGAGD